MGTTLTGTTPQDTYDSLIKVTDNGPLSGTAKYLSDGLGNDSVLALSTSQVGVGTASPAAPLNVNGSSGADFLLSRTSGATSGVLGTIRFGNQNVDSNMSAISAEQDGANNAANLIFSTQATGGATAERMRITSAGNVGIGTSSPSTRLTVDNSALGTTRAIDLVGNGSTVKGRLGVFSDGVYLSSNYFFDGAQNNDVSGLGQTLIVLQSAASSASSILFRTSAAGSTVTTTRASIDADGLKFGADTAAANALDDYEEGTWTIGVTFGGASVGVTTSSNTGTYTKIGRQVTVNGLITLTSKGSSTGDARITGLPFTIANTNSNYAAPSLYLSNISFLNQFQSYGNIGTTQIILAEISSVGVGTNLTNADFANNSEIIFNFTYFV